MRATGAPQPALLAPGVVITVKSAGETARGRGEAGRLAQPYANIVINADAAKQYTPERTRASV